MARKKAGKTLEPFLVDLEVGQPLTHLNLTLVPLRGEGHERLDYAPKQLAGADILGTTRTYWSGNICNQAKPPTRGLALSCQDGRVARADPGITGICPRLS